MPITPVKARKTLEISTNTDSVPDANRDGFPERSFRVNMRYFFPVWSGDMSSVIALVTVILTVQVALFAETKAAAEAKELLETFDK